MRRAGRLVNSVLTNVYVACTDLRIITEDSVAASIVASFDNFLLDCDGVLWMAGETLAAVRETITMLQGLGKKVLFVTNNSCKSRAMYAKKMAGLGFNVSEADLIPSVSAAMPCGALPALLTSVMLVGAAVLRGSELPEKRAPGREEGLCRGFPRPCR